MATNKRNGKTIEHAIPTEEKHIPTTRTYKTGVKCRCSEKACACGECHCYPDNEDQSCLCE